MTDYIVRWWLQETIEFGRWLESDPLTLEQAEHVAVEMNRRSVQATVERIESAEGEGSETL